MDDITVKDGFLGQKMIVLPNEVKKQLGHNHITKSFYVTDLGFYPNATNHYRQRIRGANEYIFIYCTQGTGWLEIQSKRIEIIPNQYFIIQKEIPHQYGAAKDTPWSIYWMHFDGSMASSLFNRCRSKMDQLQITPFSNDRVQLFNQAFDIFKSNYVEPQIEYANILSLSFISSFIYQDLDQPEGNQGRGRLVDAIITFLLKNIDKSYKSEDIAKEFNYSPSHIFNLFKQRTGYSLIHFFNLKKMQKACEYLDYTDLTVKEISFKLGFQDPLYFSRLFKKYMGVSPRGYKRGH